MPQRTRVTAANRANAIIVPFVSEFRKRRNVRNLVIIKTLVDQQQFNRIGRALADPRRMEILERIARDGEVACSALASESDVSQPTISHHLKELCTAGLIQPRKEAKFIFYSADRRVWAEYLKEMRRRVPARPR